MRSVLAGVLVWVAAGPAMAQQVLSGRAAERAVLQACGPETATFCPHDENGLAPSGRNTAICLKPFKSNLSLSCRHAVSALFP